MSWDLSHLEQQSGRVVVITGANSGIGYEAALALAGKGAQVVLACRDTGKATAAQETIRQTFPAASVDVITLDLASLASIRACATQVQQQYERLDVLINNAGVMAIPRRETEDGFEMQLGTNHLGHFALTGLLLDRIKQTNGARIVTVSSIAHQFGFMNFFDLHGRFFYDPWLAYGQSKLANLLFAYELDRRCSAANLDVQSVACHPGVSATNLPTAAPRMLGAPFVETLIEMFTPVVAQPAATGALPTLYAGFSPEVRGGDYTGPDGIGELRGKATKVTSNFMSRSGDLARRLWEESEKATGVTYQF